MIFVCAFLIFFVFCLAFISILKTLGEPVDDELTDSHGWWTVRMNQPWTWKSLDTEGGIVETSVHFTPSVLNVRTEQCSRFGCASISKYTWARLSEKSQMKMKMFPPHRQTIIWLAARPYKKWKNRYKQMNKWWRDEEKEGNSPICSTMSGGKTREAKALRKMSENSLSRPPIPILSKFQSGLMMDWRDPRVFAFPGGVRQKQTLNV